MAMGKMVFLGGLFAACLLPASLDAQGLNWDNSGHSLVFRPKLPALPGRFSLNDEFDYSISATAYSSINGKDDKTAGQLAFLQSIKYKISIISKRVQITNDLVHNLGLVYYLDSISKFQTDENTLNTRISFSLEQGLRFMLSSILTTRLFNAWDASAGAGGSVTRTINSSFLTPLVCTFSGGLGFELKKTGIIDIGLSSAKLTWLLDQGIFDKTGRDTFYGVEKGQRKHIEYGLSMHLLVDRAIGKKLQWNCDLLLFKADQSQVDLTLKNLFAYRINNYLKTSLQTRLFYDEDVSKQLRMENLLSFGFDFHL